MDKTIIFTLVLSACFVGSILWLVIHARRRQSALARARRRVPPVREDARRTRGGR